jgi:hypothetical protein
MNKDYEIVGRIDKPGEPTLKDLIAILMQHRRDRVALVKEPSEGREPGLIIMLIGNDAIRGPGRFLLALAQTLRSKPDEALYIKPDQSCRHIMEWMHTTGQEWCHQSLRIGRWTGGMVIALYGPFVNDTLCAELTTRFDLACRLK